MKARDRGRILSFDHQIVKKSLWFCSDGANRHGGATSAEQQRCKDDRSLRSSRSSSCLEKVDVKVRLFVGQHSGIEYVGRSVLHLAFSFQTTIDAMERGGAQWPRFGVTLCCDTTLLCCCLPAAGREGRGGSTNFTVAKP